MRHSSTIFQPKIRSRIKGSRPLATTSRIPITYKLIRRSPPSYILLLVRLDILPEHIILGTYNGRRSPRNGRHSPLSRSLQLHARRLHQQRRLCVGRHRHQPVFLWRSLPAFCDSNVRETHTKMGFHHSGSGVIGFNPRTVCFAEIWTDATCAV